MTSNDNLKLDISGHPYRSLFFPCRKEVTIEKVIELELEGREYKDIVLSLAYKNACLEERIADLEQKLLTLSVLLGSKF